MLESARKWLLLAVLFAMPWEVPAQPRETSNERSSEDALRTLLSSGAFRMTMSIVEGGVDEPACATGAFATLRDNARMIGGRKLDGTSVAAHTGRSLMLIFCMESGTGTQAYVMVASDDASEADRLKQLGLGFARMSRMSNQSGPTTFKRPPSQWQANHMRDMHVHVGYKARRAMTADRCVLEVRQAMAKAGLRRLEWGDGFVLGTDAQGVAVAVCAAAGNQTNFRLAAFGSENLAAMQLRDRVTAAIPGHPGEKPQMQIHLRESAEKIRRPNP